MAEPRRPLSPERIERAAALLDARFRGTPQFVDDALSAALGCRLLVKVETLNPIGSFKARGSETLLAALARREAERLVCASAGNFGQALAWSCRERGGRLTVFAARAANSDKVARMRALGARVILEGRDFDEAKAAARVAAAASGARYVEDGHEPEISEGAGSIAVELAAGSEPLETLLVPTGNGALLAGIACWIRGKASRIRVVAVGSEGAPAMIRSIREGRPVVNDAASTIADGIAVRVPVPAAVRDLEGRVDDTLLVSDRSLVEAMRLLHRHLGLVIEPAGVAGVAAILEHPDAFEGRPVATILCGRHVDRERRQEWLNG